LGSNRDGQNTKTSASKVLRLYIFVSASESSFTLTSSVRLWASDLFLPKISGLNISITKTAIATAKIKAKKFAIQLPF
jgi:hypothetical protein